jgi:hypothetical protein
MKRLALCLCALLTTALPAAAQSAGEFYKGRKMTLITSASVGGGYDQYARLLSRHMPKYIEGGPSMIVQNMPGAEGIKAANYLYVAAPTDGSVIGGLQRNTGLVKFYHRMRNSTRASSSGLAQRNRRLASSSCAMRRRPRTSRSCALKRSPPPPLLVIRPVPSIRGC